MKSFWGRKSSTRKVKTKVGGIRTVHVKGGVSKRSPRTAFKMATRPKKR